MAIILNKIAFEHAKKLIKEGKLNKGEGNWSESQPTTAVEDSFITNFGLDFYERWFLGINTDSTPDTKGRYEFPIGNFKEVFRSGIVAAKQRAGQYHHAEVEEAAGELLNLIDKTN